MALKPFEEIVIEHGPTVLRVCRAIVGWHQAEDAWSETFIAALRAYPGLDPQANVQAWLVTIARRKAIDQLRADARNPLPVEQLPEPAGRGIPGLARPEQGTPEDHEDLWAALKSLPVKQREALAYHHLAGLPYAQVAAILGNSEAAARRASADGMKKLRSIYQGASR